MQWTNSMKITYFSWLRTKTGIASEEIAHSNAITTISDLLSYLSKRYPDIDAIVKSNGSLRFTVNRRYVEDDHPVGPADVIGLFPPVTGG
jgi:molybdopterin synthase sulfur carrier subunit